MGHVDHHQLKTEAVRLGHGLIVYKQPKRPGRGSPNWYVRVTMPVGGRKVHTKTTGTSDFRLARERAQEFQGELLLTKKGGIAPQGEVSDRAYRFDVIADAWLDDVEMSGRDDRRKLHRYRDHRKILMAPNGLLAFFGKRDIRTITSKFISDYLDFAEQHSASKSLRPTTKNNHLSTLSKLLNAAVDMGRLDRVPRIPRVTAKDNPRAAFTDVEYRRLRESAYALERQARMEGRFDEARAYRELRDFIVIMVNSFLRPSEWAGLKQKHIEIVEKPNLHLRIIVNDGKTRKRVAVSMPGAVRAYRRVLNRCGVDPERFVFLPQYDNRATALERMRDRFNDLLERTNLGFDPFGRKRTLYSLRHTALMLRLLKGDGVNLLALARNAGTSIRMLERFYCSHLHAEQKVANLQSFRWH